LETTTQVLGKVYFFDLYLITGIMPEKKQIKNAHTFFNPKAQFTFPKAKARRKNGYRIRKGIANVSVNHAFQIGVNIKRRVSFKAGSEISKLMPIAGVL
jgi:hypothetical protein